MAVKKLRKTGDIQVPKEKRSGVAVAGLVLVFALFASVLQAQTICAPCEFEWDVPANMAGITEYRLYMSQSSGAFDWATPALTVPVSSTEGDVVTAPSAGIWYVVVVASDGTNISPPSNEVAIQWPLGSDQAPGNLRIRVTIGADGSLLIDVERTADNGTE